MPGDIIFEPLKFRNLTVKNRVFRSNISGRFDNYDGSGNQARINWETKFASGGVGAIISSFVPVHLRGRIVPNYAMIDHDRHIPFWRALGEAVHAHDCKFIMQLSHCGRQRDINGIEYPSGLSSTDKADPIHGFRCERMTIAQIREVVQYFAEGARRAREAGLDGVELHGANGYLITQFLSSAINDRDDDYGGSLENRARFVLDIVKAIRARVGNDFHLQMKISADRPRRCAGAVRTRAVGKYGRGLRQGVPVAGGGRRGCDPRVHRQLLSAPEEPGGAGPSGRGSRQVLRHDDLERRADVRELPAVQRRIRADCAPGLERRGGQAREHRRRQPACGAADQAGGDGPGDLHGRVPDGVVHSRRAHPRRLRCRERRAAPRRQQRSGQACSRRGWTQPPTPVQLLQQVPRQRRREPARLLRRGPLRAHARR